MREQIVVPIIMVGGFLLITTVVVRLIARSTLKTYENMKHLAERLKLTVPEVKPVLGFYKTPEVTGVIREKPVRVYTFTTGSGKNQTTWSAAAVTPRATGGLTFSLSRQGLGTKLLEIFGSKEIKVGDEAFDKKWFIQTNAPDFMAIGLLPELQQKISAFEGKWELKRNEVIYTERGSFNSRDRCERWPDAVDAACDLADAAEVYAQQKQA